MYPRYCAVDMKNQFESFALTNSWNFLFNWIVIRSMSTSVIFQLQNKRVFRGVFELTFAVALFINLSTITYSLRITVNTEQRAKGPTDHAILISKQLTIVIGDCLILVSAGQSPLVKISPSFIREFRLVLALAG